MRRAATSVAGHGVCDDNSAGSSGERGDGAGARGDSSGADWPMSAKNKFQGSGIHTRTCGCGVGTSNSRKDLGRHSGDRSDGHSVWLADFL